MDKSSQDIAAGADESASAGESLSEQARQMLSFVETMSQMIGRKKK